MKKIAFFFVSLVILCLVFLAITKAPTTDELIISISAIKLNCSENFTQANKFFPEEPHLIPFIYGLPLRVLGCQNTQAALNIEPNNNEQYELIKKEIFPQIILFRIETIITFIAFLFSFYFLSKKFFNERIATFSVMIFSVLPVVFEMGFRVYYEFCFLFLFFLAAKYYSENKDKEEQKKFYFVVLVLFILMISTRFLIPFLLFPVFLLKEYEEKTFKKGLFVVFLAIIFLLYFSWGQENIYATIKYSYVAEAKNLIRNNIGNFLINLIKQIWFFVPAIIYKRNKIFNEKLSFFYALLLVYSVFFSITRTGSEPRYILIFLALFVFLFTEALIEFLKDIKNKWLGNQTERVFNIQRQ